MKFVLQFLASVCNCVRLFGLTKQARGEQAVEDRIRAEEYEVDRLLSPSPALKTDLPLGDESDDDSIAKPLSQDDIIRYISKKNNEAQTGVDEEAWKYEARNVPVRSIGAMLYLPSIRSSSAAQENTDQSWGNHSPISADGEESEDYYFSGAGRSDASGEEKSEVIGPGRGDEDEEDYDEDWLVGGDADLIIEPEGVALVTS
eukprot:GHVU01069150.1.p1 GENE.GHVU01069150.1~~GHVU01069150.1.p1  ORF type:complete len:202 (+),score=34.49 GHVU01069150.1:107-712(+)